MPTRIPTLQATTLPSRSFFPDSPPVQTMAPVATFDPTLKPTTALPSLLLSTVPPSQASFAVLDVQDANSKNAEGALIDRMGATTKTSTGSQKTSAVIALIATLAVLVL